MLLEQESEVLTTTQYENYLDSGGRLPEQEYLLVSELLRDQVTVFYKKALVSQILSILDNCELEAFLSEVLIYNILRERISSDDQISNQTDIRSKNLWCMCDQELVREIVFLSDETGEKYRIITEKYPNIFRD